MGVTSMSTKGSNKAVVTCDCCGRQEIVVCSHMRANGTWRAADPNEGQILRKLTSKGWTKIKNKWRCPTCEAERLQQKGPTVTTPAPEAPAAPLRGPSKEMEVDIIVALSSVYSRPNKRYIGKETDRSVAEAVGDGCMPGWVAAIREEKFGPGGNEELDEVRAEIAALHNRHDEQFKALDKEVSEARDFLQQSLTKANHKMAEIEKTRKNLEVRFDAALQALTKKVDGVVASHDKRVK